MSFLNSVWWTLLTLRLGLIVEVASDDDVFYVSRLSLLLGSIRHRLRQASALLWVLVRRADMNDLYVQLELLEEVMQTAQFTLNEELTMAGLSGYWKAQHEVFNRLARMRRTAIYRFQAAHLLRDLSLEYWHYRNQALQWVEDTYYTAYFLFQRIREAARSMVLALRSRDSDTILRLGMETWESEGQHYMDLAITYDKPEESDTRAELTTIAEECFDLSHRYYQTLEGRQLLVTLSTRLQNLRSMVRQHFGPQGLTPTVREFQEYL